MQDANTKQQIVEKLKSSTNILVTVGSNPSVDELSAALGLTLMLDRMDKHGTAVFSGAIPPAISFLEPEKTFENTVDSLRDFIIALDKEKADRLRYKVEDDVVRIFITPYKTVINENDLQFSQGDFNVELIVALGVEKREDLDAAITAHGRILHDATVVTLNTNGAQSSLGAIDWTDTEAGGLCEMLMSISEALQPGLLDQQIATALLTGIVAATDRFRNERTSPKVMTMSAQLMVAGANQQLIAEKLEQGNGLDTEVAAPAPDGTVAMPEGDASEKLVDEPVPEEKSDDGALEIVHESETTASPASPAEPGDEALKVAETELAQELEQKAQDAAQPTDNLQQDLQQAHEEELASQPEQPAGLDNSPQIVKEHRTWQTDNTVETPSFGGTLNATTTDAEEAKQREANSTYNRQLLSHDAPAATVADEAPSLGAAPAPDASQVPSLPPLPAVEEAPLEQSREDAMLTYEPAPLEQPTGPTLSELDNQTRGRATEEARAAVDAVLDSVPFDPARLPLESAGAVPAIEVNHDATPPLPPADPMAQPPMQPMPDMMPPATPPPAGLPTPPPLPPLPDFSTLPPLPGAPEEAGQPQAPYTAQDFSQPAAPAVQQSADPGQFRIPGQ